LENHVDLILERWQWMRNAEGGQTFGNRQEISSITESIFIEYIYPRLCDGYAKTLDEYKAKCGADILCSFLEFNRNGERKLHKVGTIKELRPSQEALLKGWAIKVDSFLSNEALCQGLMADTNNI
jgi:hypothetical protein